MNLDMTECGNQVMLFFRHLDERDYDALVSLLAPDAVWHRQGKQLRGPAEALQALRQRSPNMRIAHIITNLVVDHIDAGRCTMRGYMLVVRHETDQALDGPAPLDGIESIRTIHVALKRRDTGWLIDELSNDPIAFAAVP
ncbi:nuclear transport factor 2 family protein [Alcaligenaceae bacterium]|nr:nuclear transport factor 2 family protein [Alcaligenaceae bacterium]